jgi:O-antigen ligase
MSNGSPVFLKNRLNFLAIVLVLLTTIFGWFMPNSWAVMLVVACRLLYGNPVANIRTAFSNRLFLAFFIFFLIDAAGYLHTHDPGTEGKILSKEATMVAIAFVFCAGEFADGQTYRRLITAYSLLLVAASVYCLVLAWLRYRVNQSRYELFYHPLTAPISHNAVFFSIFMLFGIVFLLSRYGEPAIGFLSKRGRKVLRYALFIFFLGMMVMLSSRLLLVITPLILFDIISRRFSDRRRKLVLLIAGALVLIAVGMLGSSNNFISWRFGEIREGQLSVLKQQQFDPNTHFSSWDSRLLQWRYAGEILNAGHAWLFGVSPGDSQKLLDQKYIDAHMDIGNPAEGPNRHIRGYLGFNFHDQYVETLVRTGLVGLTSLLAIFALLFARARRSGVRESWFVILTIAVFFIFESPLTLQDGVFLFCFFPLLVLDAPRAAGSGRHERDRDNS